MILSPNFVQYWTNDNSISISRFKYNINNDNTKLKKLNIELNKVIQHKENLSKPCYNNYNDDLLFSNDVIKYNELINIDNLNIEKINNEINLIKQIDINKNNNIKYKKDLKIIFK